MIVREHAYTDGGLALRGLLAYDETKPGARPGILVVPEAPGLTEHAKRRVRMLAELGYIAFGVDLYGQGRLAEGMEETMAWLGQLRADVNVWRKRIRAGLDALSALEQTDSNRLGAIGYCAGGSSVLELARSGAPVRAVVSFHGELTPTPHAAGAIKAKVLVCAGAQDAFATVEQRAAFEREMEEAGVDWQLALYGAAKHAFTNIEADQVGMPIFGYQEAADRRSWRAMLEWLADAGLKI